MFRPGPVLIMDAHTLLTGEHFVGLQIVTISLFCIQQLQTHATMKVLSSLGSLAWRS